MKAMLDRMRALGRRCRRRGVAPLVVIAVLLLGAAVAQAAIQPATPKPPKAPFATTARPTTTTPRPTTTTARPTTSTARPTTTTPPSTTAPRPTTTTPPSTTAPRPTTTTPPSTSPPVSTPSSDGNEAPEATLTQDAAGGGSDPRALVDGSGVAGAEGAGLPWTVARPQGTWVQATWTTPQELTSVSVLGAASSARLAAATLTFSDGSTLPLGAVLVEPERPTILAFNPKQTSSVRLTLTKVSGSGSLALSELRTYRKGATPVRSTSGPESASPSASPAPAASCATSTAGTRADGLVVTCPTLGSTASGRVGLRTSTADGLTQVKAVVWSNIATDSPSAPVTATPDSSGNALLTVDLTAARPGPVTVRVDATGAGQTARTVNFQLVRAGTAADVPSTGPVTGRTLAYDEEFNAPVSLSRDGIGADYAAAKPTWGGAEDFGSAVFPDPRKNLGNVAVSDGRLRIGVEPLPKGYTDPFGWGRTHIGGMLASSRWGGSGFSAQYGYFEARMYTPAVPGTWPAFWMLPSDNLVAATPKVAEIDAAELYGQFPRGSCQSTHDYHDGTDTGVGNCSESRFSTDREAMAWHTYGVSITPTGNTFYVDGKVVATAPQVSGGAAPMFFLLDHALGGGWPVDLSSTGERATLYVDYVRVYV